MNKQPAPKKPLTQQQTTDRSKAFNSNPGSTGKNIVNAKVHGNRGKLLNPNQR